jgi:hypothetical protein
MPSSAPYPLPSMAFRRYVPRVMRMEELAMSFISCNTQKIGPCISPRQQDRAGPGSRVHCRRAGSEGMRGTAVRLSSSDMSQTQFQGFELVHSKGYTIDEWLECMKLVLQIQNYSISKTC